MHPTARKARKSVPNFQRMKIQRTSYSHRLCRYVFVLRSCVPKGQRILICSKHPSSPRGLHRMIDQRLTHCISCDPLTEPPWKMPPFWFAAVLYPSSMSAPESCSLQIKQKERTKEIAQLQRLLNFVSAKWVGSKNSVKWTTLTKVTGRMELCRKNGRFPPPCSSSFQKILMFVPLDLPHAGSDCRWSTESNWQLIGELPLARLSTRRGKETAKSLASTKKSVSFVSW